MKDRIGLAYQRGVGQSLWKTFIFGDLDVRSDVVITLFCGDVCPWMQGYIDK